MKASILEKLDRLKERYEEVSAMLSEADTINNQNKFRDLSKEYAELEPVVQGYQNYLNLLANIERSQKRRKLRAWVRWWWYKLTFRGYKNEQQKITKGRFS